MIAAQRLSRLGVPSFRPALVLLQTLIIAHTLVYLLNPTVELGAPLRVFSLINIGVGGAIIGLLLALRDDRLPAARAALTQWRLPLVGGALLYGFALALIPLPEAVVPHLLHTHMTLTALITFTTLSVTLLDFSVPIRLPHTLLIGGAAAAIVVICGARIYSLTSYPFIDWQDEAWTMAWTQSFMETGRFSDPTFVGLGDAYYAYPRFYIGMAAWFQLVGIGLWQGRLFGFLLIFPLIAFSALAARNLFGTRTAWVTAAFMFSSAVVMSAARIRHDIGLAICVAASLWLYSEAVKREGAADAGRRAPALHFLAGLVVALGMFSHYHAAGFGVALLVGLYAPRYLAQVRRASLPPLRRVIPGTAIWLFGIGGLLGALLVLGLQMIPDDLNGWLYALRAEGKYSEDGGEFFVAFFGNFISIGFFSVFDLLLIGAGAIMAARRRRTADVLLLLILIASHLLLAVMASGAIYYYILPLTPIYAMLVATVLDNFILTPQPPLPQGEGESYRNTAFNPGTIRMDTTKESLKGKHSKPLALRERGWGEGLVLLAFLLIPSLGATLRQPVQHVLNGAPLHLPPPPAAQWVLDNVPTDQVVAGDLRYRLWLYEYPFASHLIPDFLYPENLALRDSPETLWRAVDMDVLLVDPDYPRSYKFFRPLVESGFMARYGYERAADFPASGTIIFAR